MQHILLRLTSDTVVFLDWQTFCSLMQYWFILRED